MKIRLLVAVLAGVACICSCGTSAKTTEGASSDGSTSAAQIDMQTDPLVLELETFEGRTFGGERSFIALFNDKIQAKIPTVVGMVRAGMMTSTFALTFDKCTARIGEPRADKKGTSYYFNVYAKDGRFFNSIISTDWRLRITVWDDGQATVYIESDEIARVASSRSWRFEGHVNKERTDALKLIVGTNADFNVE